MMKTRRQSLAAIVVSAALIASSLVLGAPAMAEESDDVSLLAVGFCTKSIQRTATNGSLITVPATSGNNPDCRMEQGANSEAVRALQRQLNSTCGVSARLVVDGAFGPATAAALRSAQSKYRVTADGIYGTNTAQALGWPTFPSGCGFQRF